MTPDLFADGLPTLRTARLALRTPTAADADALLEVFGDADALRYWSHGPFADRAAALDYLLSIQEGIATRVRYQWAITRPGEDRLLGTVTLAHVDAQNRRAEVGYILGPAHWGQGLALEAVRGVFAFAFGPMDLHRIEADVHPDNAASVALLRRLGFREEGLLRERWFTFGEWSDSQLFGLLRREYATPGA